MLAIAMAPVLLTGADFLQSSGGQILTLLLLGLLAVQVLLGAHRGLRARAWTQVLQLIVLPLLVLFGLGVALHLAHLMALI